MTSIQVTPIYHRFRRQRLLSATVLLALALCCGLIGSIAPSTAAQGGVAGQLNDVSFPTLRPFGTEKDATVAVAVGDMDGDGDLDIVAGNENEAGMISFNDGVGNFPVTEQHAFGEAGDVDSLALGDLNGDGDLDIAISYADGSVRTYTNDGAGTVGPGDVVAEAVGSGVATALALGDMNGDGFFDIVLARANEEAHLFENDGTGRFPVSKTLGDNSYDARTLALAHMDDNDVLDLIVTPAQGPVTILYRDNNGDNGTEQLGAADLRVETFVVGDFTDDGQLDVAVAAPPSQPLLLFINQSERSFSKFEYPLSEVLWNSVNNQLDSFGQGRNDSWTIAVGDLNGDGKLDLALGLDFKNWLNRVLLNTGGGSFSNWYKMTFGSEKLQARAIALADLNGDGFLDIVSGNLGAHNLVYLNSGRLSLALLDLTPSIPESTDKQIVSLVLGDINKDGLLDIVTGKQPTLFINQGKDNYRAESFDDTLDTFAIGLADVNGDGWQDVIAGNNSSERAIYFNDGVGGFSIASRHLITGSNPAHKIPDRGYRNTSLAVGDLDGIDGLDLVLCSTNRSCDIYYNDKTGRFTTDRAIPLGEKGYSAVAVADLNNDDSLDIVVASLGGQNHVFLNNGVGQFPAPLHREFGTGIDWTRAIAIADMNGDGHPDILTGNFYEQGAIYLNDGAGNFPTRRENVRRFGDSSDKVYSLAVGDVNGDGAMDFATGHWGSVTDPDAGVSNALYLNDGIGNFSSMALGGPHWTQTIAMGDMDGNGTLDIVEGNRYVEYVTPRKEYLSVHRNYLRASSRLANSSIAITMDTVTSSFGHGSGESISLPFALSDQESDLVARIEAYYSLDGGGQWTPIQISNSDKTTHLATSPSGVSHRINWDVASAVFGRSDNTVVQIRAYSQPRISAAPGTYRYPNSVPSLNQWPYATTTSAPFSVQGTSVRVFTGTQSLSNALVYLLPKGKDRGGEPIGGTEQPFHTDAQGFLPGRTQLHEGDSLIAVWATNIVTDLTPTRRYASFDSFPITVTAGTPVISTLDVFDSRRIAAINVWVDISATLPISLALGLESPQGERVELQNGAALETHLIFTPTLNAPPTPLAAGSWTLTSSTTISTPIEIQGWGLALQLSPLHLTSAQPIIGGLSGYTVTGGVEQRLVISEAYPLLLFDLNVALEWDASKDEQYKARLSADLRRASEMLYDWTNGQVALGNVRVYHDARTNRLPDGSDAWSNAHIRIYATNRLRPNADQGGFLSEMLTESVELNGGAKDIAYLPGQVRIGAQWNRFGEASRGDLGEDWSAALAHELGHYLLFLNDNYLSLENNLIIPLGDEDCPGAMNNPYSTIYSEFHPSADWDKGDGSGCMRTLSGKDTGRSDWETINRFYPWLRAPEKLFDRNDSGPNLLPLAVTQVIFQNPDPNSDLLTWLAQIFEVPESEKETVFEANCLPGASSSGDRLSKFSSENVTEAFGCASVAITSTAPLAVPIFYFKKVDGEGDYRASPSARAFLFRGPPYRSVIDLGQPSGDQLLARGARPIDWLCVYDTTQGYAGCEQIEPGDDQLEVQFAPDWKPQLILTPKSASELQVKLVLPDTENNKMLDLITRLYPSNRPALALVKMEQDDSLTENEIVYSAIIHTSEPILEGYVWVGVKSNENASDQKKAARRAIAEFAISGNSVRVRGLLTSKQATDISFVRVRGLLAPAASSDGQVTIHPDETLAVKNEWSFILQPAIRLPKEIPWATQVGRAYWLAASSHIPDTGDITDFGNSSITFQYLGVDVPPGEEPFLRLYFWDGKSCSAIQHTCWQQVEGQKLYTDHNLIAARLRGPGLYALFSSFDIALDVGWNFIGYPVFGSRPITEALASIASSYDIVYGYTEDRPDDPWSVFVPKVAEWGSDLKEMRFGQGYLIHNTRAATLHIKGNSVITSALLITAASPSLRTPPALFYGNVTSERADFTPKMDMEVIAEIGGEECGKGHVVDTAGNYLVKVQAADQNKQGCGILNSVVAFRVGGLMAAITTTWENNAPHHLPLSIIEPVPPVDTTPEETPTPEQTPTPPPPPAPAVQCQEQTRDGGFAANDVWMRPATDSQAQIVMDDRFGDGSSLFLGSRTARSFLTYSTAYEDILLPANASHTTLTFVYQTDDSGSGQGRFIQLQTLDQTPLITFPLNGTDSLNTFTYDLTAYQGSWIRIFFQVTNSVASGARWMGIDDVSVQSCRAQ